MKAVHFGAGNIGRGFIGLLLARSGYDVTFIDPNAALVRDLNALGRYPVHAVGSAGKTTHWVDGVTAIDAADTEAVARAIGEADIVTTAVGKSSLAYVAPVIASGLARRRHDALPILVVACENVLGNSAYLKRLVDASCVDGPSAFQAAIFPDCVVDRIVPNMARRESDHPLAVTVEEYAQWVIDSTGLSSLPTIVGAEFRAGLEAVLWQKLFTLNLAHAIAAYLGLLHGLMYIHEAMGIDSIRELMLGALREAGIVVSMRHGIAPTAQAAYASAVIERLGNSALADTVVRVGRDPKRKLGPSDRLILPAVEAARLGHVPAHLAAGIAAALAYDVPGDPQSIELGQLVRAHGVRGALHRVSGIPVDHPVAQLVTATALYRSL